MPPEASPATAELAEATTPEDMLAAEREDEALLAADEEDEALEVELAATDELETAPLLLIEKRPDWTGGE